MVRNFLWLSKTLAFVCPPPQLFAKTFLGWIATVSASQRLERSAVFMCKRLWVNCATRSNTLLLLLLLLLLLESAANCRYSLGHGAEPVVPAASPADHLCSRRQCRALLLWHLRAVGDHVEDHHRLPGWCFLLQDAACSAPRQRGFRTLYCLGNLESVAAHSCLTLASSLVQRGVHCQRGVQRSVPVGNRKYDSEETKKTEVPMLNLLSAGGLTTDCMTATLANPANPAPHRLCPVPHRTTFAASPAQ